MSRGGICARYSSGCGPIFSVGNCGNSGRSWNTGVFFQREIKVFGIDEHGEVVTDHIAFESEPFESIAPAGLPSAVRFAQRRLAGDDEVVFNHDAGRALGGGFEDAGNLRVFLAPRRLVVWHGIEIGPQAFVVHRVAARDAAGVDVHGDGAAHDDVVDE